MAIILILMRHAQAEVKAPHQQDRERALTAIGHLEANAAGAYLKNLNLTPEFILCSPALRTRQTLEDIQVSLPASAVTLDDALYLSDTAMLARIAANIPDNAQTALIIGHNPGISNFATRMARHGPAELKNQLWKGFPTAGLAIITAENWDILAQQGGTLKDYWFPALPKN